MKSENFHPCEHPLYFLDWLPRTTTYSPKMKKELSGGCFPSDNDVMNAIRGFLEDQDKAFNAEGICKLKGRWTKCVSMQGDYVEK